MIARLRARMEDPQTSLPRKYRVLFALKNMMDSGEAHEAMLAGLKDTSVLFRHEVAYCLGQTQKEGGIADLVRILSDVNEHPMVRHEAGEALGAIGTTECVHPLELCATDASPEVRETCVLALQRMRHASEAASQHSQSRYSSVDPTPAESASTCMKALETSLLDEEAAMFDRYKALFALRNIGGESAVHAISKAFNCSSALLKHEVAFVLGQMQDPESIQSLKHVLENVDENPMVRHEAAEALGSIADDACMDLLNHYSNDSEPIVAESCVVALDMLEHEQSGAFEYVDTETETNTIN